MTCSTERVLRDVQRVAAELEGMLEDAAGTAEADVRRGLRATDRYVRRNAWQSVAAVAGLAFLAGFLLGRRG